MRRCLKYCLSKRELDLWPDLHAANNRSTQKYKAFFDIAGEVIEKVSSVHPYMHSCKNYLFADHADSVSVSSIHGKIPKRMKLNNKDPRTEYEIPSKQFL